MRRSTMIPLVMGSLFFLGCGTSDSRGVGSGASSNPNGTDSDSDNNGNNNGNSNGNDGTGDDGTGDDGTGDNGGGTDVNCGVQNFTLVHGVTPKLLIVFDRSGSMAWAADGGKATASKPSRWSQMVAGVEQVVSTVTTIDWGLLMFANDGDCGVPSQPDVAVAASSASAIKAALDAASPEGATPTTAAIKAATQYFSGDIDSNGQPKYLLLATDGEPNCGGSFGLDDDAAGAEQAVTDAATAGIHTFVVGVGSTTDDEAVLTQMAKNGLEPNTTAGQPAYYPASSTADLVSAMQKIAGQIVSCSYDLQTAPTNPDLVEIKDELGNTIPHDTTHADGWDFGPGNTSIVFYGAACTDLQKGVTTGISAVYGCPPVS